MKTFVVVLVALYAVAFSSAEDDGQYRPHLYGADDGQYHPGDEGRYFAYKYVYPYYQPYNDVFTRNGRVNPYFAAYQPYAFAPYHQVLTPVVAYGDQNSIDQAAFATSLTAVTLRPPVAKIASTATPTVSSTTLKPVLQDIRFPVYGRQFAYSADKQAKIVRQDNDLDGNAYHYLYQTDNGINAEEAGQVNPVVNGGGTKATGFYEYVGDDGLKYRVDYTADENGFRPVGAHLP